MEKPIWPKLVSSDTTKIGSRQQTGNADSRCTVYLQRLRLAASHIPFPKARESLGCNSINTPTISIYSHEVN